MLDENDRHTRLGSVFDIPSYDLSRIVGAFIIDNHNVIDIIRHGFNDHANLGGFVVCRYHNTDRFVFKHGATYSRSYFLIRNPCKFFAIRLFLNAVDDLSHGNYIVFRPECRLPHADHYPIHNR
jgi:hypothetical protein